MKSRINRRHPLNTNLRKATLANGASKQTLHPLYECKMTSMLSGHHLFYMYSKTCLKRPLRKDKTMMLMTNGTLMKVENIAE